MTSRPLVTIASPDAVARWDELTVHVADGDVRQSLAWSAHRSATGWLAHFLATDDGGFALALGRRLPLPGAGLLYVPGGPVGAGAGAATRADRLSAIATWAGEHGYDEVVSDAEVPAATGYPELLTARGFHGIDEIEPSRHRMSTPIPSGISEDDMRALLALKARQPINAAERRGYRVIRHDALALRDPGPGFEAPPAGDPRTVSQAALERFHGLLVSTGERLGFHIGPRVQAIAWWQAALAAGHLVLLEVRAPDDTYLGGAMFTRQGARLTYAYSAGVASLRSEYPGVANLVLWRALQLGIREGRAELDLGGVDVVGARHRPEAGDAMYGLYKFKLGFHAEWIEQSGAHAKVIHATRRLLRRGLGRSARMARESVRAARRAAGSMHER